MNIQQFEAQPKTQEEKELEEIFISIGIKKPISLIAENYNEWKSCLEFSGDKVFDSKIKRIKELLFIISNGRISK